MSNPPVWPGQYAGSGRPWPPRFRLLLIALLAAAVVVVMSVSGGPYEFASRSWLAPPGQVTIAADILYRLAAALAASGRGNEAGGVNTRDLEQAALALYERSALGPEQSAQASYRLGIFYARAGYYEQAQEMFARAILHDEGNIRLYGLLSRLYAAAPATSGVPADAAALLEQSALLRNQDRWLATLTLADLYACVGQPARAAELRAEWQTRQVLFAALIGGVLMFYLLMGLGGLVLLAALCLRWLSRPPARPQPRSASPATWSVLDIGEAVVVLLFLMASLAVLTTLARERLGLASEMYEALLVVASYLVATAGTIILIVWRLGRGRPYARLLGLRTKGAGRQIGQGVAGYAILVGLVVAIVLALKLLGLEALTAVVAPLAKAPTELLTEVKSPAALAVYFVLIVLIAPVAEEIIFRGFVYAGLRRTMTVPAAALGSAFIFAAVHVSTPASGLAVIVVVGTILACLYERSRSVLPCMVTHALYNGLIFALLAICTLV